MQYAERKRVDRVPAMTRARHPSCLALACRHILRMRIADPEPDCYTAPGCELRYRRGSMTWAGLMVLRASRTVHGPRAWCSATAWGTRFLCVTPPERILCPLAESFFKMRPARWLG